MESHRRQVALAADLGAKVVKVTHTAVMRHNHFTLDPPIAVQRSIMADNCARAAEVARAAGVVLAIANYLDYRLADIPHVLREVSSPALACNLDTGNAVGLIEYLEEGTRLVAPYTVMSHVTDVRLNPMNVFGMTKMFLTPIGYGHLPIGRVLEILQDRAPDPASLRLDVEVLSNWEDDPDLWVRASLDYMRANFARFLS